MTITAADLVHREVRYCVSSLVSTLANAGAFTAVNSAARDLMNLTYQAAELAAPVPDYEDAARAAGWTLETFGETRKWVNRADDDGSRYCDKESSVRHLCEDHDIEPYEREVFEHWIVSDWLADKLAEKGEKVDKDFTGLTVWARTTTGQAISCDGVIEEITAALNAA